MSEGSGVYPSPILLNDDKIKRSCDSSLTYERHVKSYQFDSKSKEWKVSSPVSLSNNQLNYHLIEFHVHIPAEHVIENKREDIEIHFQFQDVSGNILVFAFLGQVGCQSNPLWTQILENKILCIPDTFETWNYSGSLTVGVAQENVQWIVSNDPLTISPEDLAKFKSYSKPAKPIQDREGRDIVRVNHKTSGRDFWNVCSNMYMLWSTGGTYSPCSSF